MTPAELAALGAGFSDLARGSQAVFRAALDALAHPGRPVALAHDAEAPAEGHAAAAALLLALLDADSRVWLSPALARGTAGAWLRFHTGCQLVAGSADAQFAWIAAADPLPPLSGLVQGSDAFPDQSATCVVEVASLRDCDGDDHADGSWTLRGPGIRDSRRLAVQGTLHAPGFLEQWAANHAAFPCGVDLFLATPSHIAGLPRTTAITTETEATACT